MQGEGGGGIETGSLGVRAVGLWHASNGENKVKVDMKMYV